LRSFIFKFDHVGEALGKTLSVVEHASLRCHYRRLVSMVSFSDVKGLFNAL